MAADTAIMRKTLVGLAAIAMGVAFLAGPVIAGTVAIAPIVVGGVLMLGGGQSLVHGLRESRSGR